MKDGLDQVVIESVQFRLPKNKATPNPRPAALTLELTSEIILYSKGDDKRKGSFSIDCELRLGRDDYLFLDGFRGISRRGGHYLHRQPAERAYRHLKTALRTGGYKILANDHSFTLAIN